MKGVQIPFTNIPKQKQIPKSYKFSEEDKIKVSLEITKFLSQRIIEKVNHVNGEFISNIFLRNKPNGEARVILDLTKLNKKVTYQHFKMFSLKTALDLTTQSAWMGTVDLKHAYYSVSIDKDFRKFLRFIWQGQLYEFTCMPNGLAVCPRIFTKLLKPIYAGLSEQGVISFPYIDDSFVIAKTEGECSMALELLCNELTQAGFCLNTNKSKLKPSQKVKFLGFYLDTISMEVSLTEEKVNKFREFAQFIIPRCKKIKIRMIAAIIGIMTAYSQGLKYARAHIKSLELNKNRALKLAKGNFERNMIISEQGLDDLNWWLNNINGLPQKMQLDETELIVSTDASLEGWGAQQGPINTGGRWLQSEEDDHINALELKAIYLGLRSLAKITNSHVKLLTDNNTALAYVRRMGGTKSPRCNEIAKMIWHWAETRNIWLTIQYIPSKENVTADRRSRKFHDHLEWSLSQNLFEQICDTWGMPEIDLFASRKNRKLPKYVSWHPEPDSWRVDAFSFDWDQHFFYAFPPFSMVARVARKLYQDGASAILVTPLWTTQPWLAAARRWAKQSITFQGAPNNLTHSGPLFAKGDVSSIPLAAFLF